MTPEIAARKDPATPQYTIYALFETNILELTYASKIVNSKVPTKTEALKIKPTGAESTVDQTISLRVIVNYP